MLALDVHRYDFGATLCVLGIFVSYAFGNDKTLLTKFCRHVSASSDEVITESDTLPSKPTPSSCSPFVILSFGKAGLVIQNRMLAARKAA